MITTTPGFSSRSTDSHVTQLPQRDGAVMEEQKPGWSNSKGAQVSGVSVSVEVDAADEPVNEDAAADAAVEKVDQPVQVEKPKPAKKAAAKKTAAKKAS